MLHNTLFHKKHVYKLTLYKSKQGTALIFAMFIVTISMLLIMSLMSRIYPVSQQIKGIEQSNIAYYQALSGVEAALWERKMEWEGSGPDDTDPSTFVSNSLGKYKYTLTSVTNDEATTIPRSGEGNSEYNRNWNRIAPGEPLELRLKGSDITRAEFNFRIPLDGSLAPKNLVSGMDMIGWSLSGKHNTNGQWLSLIGEKSGPGTITSDEINNANNAKGVMRKYLNRHSSEGNKIYGKVIAKYSYLKTLGDPSLLQTRRLTANDLYTNQNRWLDNCTNWNQQCVLKLTLTNIPFVSGEVGNRFPYLEYQITNVSGTPYQYAKIESEGKDLKSQFARTIFHRNPQPTYSEIADFTVGN